MCLIRTLHDIIPYSIYLQGMSSELKKKKGHDKIRDKAMET